jgi:hypothetical protein
MELVLQQPTCTFEDNISFNNKISRFIAGNAASTENGEHISDSFIKKEPVKIDPIKKHLYGLIYSLQIPEKWKTEHISAPTFICKSLAERIVYKIYENYSIIPYRISATIEEGVYCNYKNYDNERTLSLEFYNDLDIAAIVTQGKKIIKAEDIVDESFSEIIKAFKAI